MDKNLKYYLSLKYPLTLMWDKVDKIYIVEYPDMPGVMAHGKTERDAIVLAEKFKKQWLKDALSAGLTIPEPTTNEDYSGRFVFRTSPANHRRLSERAKAAGKSLNSYIEMLTFERSNAIVIEKTMMELQTSEKNNATEIVKAINDLKENIADMQKENRLLASKLEQPCNKMPDILKITSGGQDYSHTATSLIFSSCDSRRETRQ